MKHSGRRRPAALRLLTEHYSSLPFRTSSSGGRSFLISWATFAAAPLAGVFGLWKAGVTTNIDGVTGGLLAGVGVLAGLLVQVLAWVAGRIGDLADSTADGAEASTHRLRLLSRLGIARANIAYACLVAIVLTMQLGVMAMLRKVPTWSLLAAAGLMLHLGLTLVLVLTRISRIALADDDAVRTAHARTRVDH